LSDILRLNCNYLSALRVSEWTLIIDSQCLLVWGFDNF
jgi:hypothetical protein